MKQRMRVGVVGLGYWGSKLTHHFQRSDEFELAALCDQLPAPLERAGALYAGVPRFSSIDELLDDCALDLVALATPVSSHCPLAISALRAGCHVLVEKPLAKSVLEADAMLAAAQQQGRRLFVDHTYLYTGAVRELARQYQSGALGELHYVDSVRVNLGLFRHDVDVIWDLAPHDLSILQFVVGAKVSSVQVVAACHNSRGHCEVAYLHLEYDNGLAAHLHLSWRSPEKIRRMAFFGQKSSLYFDDLQSADKVKVYDHEIGFESAAEPRRAEARVLPLDNEEALAVEVRELAGVLRGERAPIATGEDGREQTLVLEACERSWKEGSRRVPILSAAYRPALRSQRSLLNLS